MARLRLTRRKLEGMIAALAAIEADDVTSITGYDDAEGRRLHVAVCDALAWAKQELARRL